MRNVCLLLSVLFLQIRNSVEECRVVETAPGLPSYKCNTIDELQRQGNPESLDVTIYRGESVPVIKNATHERKPNLNVVLHEDIAGGFSPKTLNTLKSLSELFWRNTQIVSLKAGVLQNLPLEELHFEDVGLTSIEQQAFANLNNLEKLYIVKNRLNMIQTGIFNNLPVQILSLSSNGISFIERNALSNLENLVELYLDNNQLSEFQPELIMTRRDKVRVLWLNNNNIGEIDRNVVRGFTNLVELNLENNRISKIFSYTFENAPNLQRLYLSNNLLLELTPQAFPPEGMPKLTKLYIGNNRLSYLTNSLLAKMTKLESVRIGGNPWQCPCLDSILRWLGEFRVRQPCDQDYYGGTRPICVVADNHPTICDYATDQFYYYRYSEVNNKAPESPACAL